MPGWDGSGNFIRVFSWQADKAAGINIIASRMDTDTNNITNNGFGNTLTRDGQGSATSNLPMNGFRHTGVGAPLLGDQYGTAVGIQDNAYSFAVAGGTVDAITATYAPAILALVDGMLLSVRASAANATTTPTFAPNGLTAHTITKSGNQALTVGDIPRAGYEVQLRYVATGTHWEMLNPASAGSIPWVVSAGTADAITAAYSPAIVTGTLVDGLLLSFRASAANATTTPTFAPNAITAHAVTRAGGSALNVGDIPGALAECLVRYNLANTRWELMNPATASGGSSGGTAGDARNAAMKVAAASATATFTADEIVVATSLGGQSFTLTSYSQACNLGTTGAGGMDTGTAPVSGYVSLYAIYNPATNTKSILACSSATSTSTIYAGANMPAGYTASALISTWPTNGSSQFRSGLQRERRILVGSAGFPLVGGAGLTTVDISTAVPPNAITVFGYGISASAQPLYVTVGPDTVNIPFTLAAFNVGGGTDNASVSFPDINIYTAQRVNALALTGFGNPTLIFNGYTI